MIFQNFNNVNGFKIKRNNILRDGTTCDVSIRRGSAFHMASYDFLLNLDDRVAD